MTNIGLWGWAELAVFVSELLGTWSRHKGGTSLGGLTSILEWLVNNNEVLPLTTLIFSSIWFNSLACFTYLCFFTTSSVQVRWTRSSASGCHVTTMTAWWKTIKRRRTTPRKDDIRLSRDVVLPEELNILFCDEKGLWTIGMCILLFHQYM